MSEKLYVYGDILPEGDVSAKKFKSELEQVTGNSLEIHINSAGGDVFEALAIYNLLKESDKQIDIVIDGLAASSASLIICAGDRVRMAKNALIMLHEPSVGLSGYYDNSELQKIIASLSKIREVIISTYTGHITGDIDSMIRTETWLNATEALEKGLIQKVEGEAKLELDETLGLMYVNSLKVDLNNYDKAKLKRAIGGEKMTENSLLRAVLNRLHKEEFKADETQRIRALQALKCDNVLTNTLVDVAINEGKDAKEVLPYIDAVKRIDIDKVVEDRVVSMIKDQITSGAEHVNGDQESVASKDKMRSQAYKIAEFANRRVM